MSNLEKNVSNLHRKVDDKHDLNMISRLILTNMKED